MVSTSLYDGYFLVIIADKTLGIALANIKPVSLLKSQPKCQQGLGRHVTIVCIRMAPSGNSTVNLLGDGESRRDYSG